MPSVSPADLSVGAFSAAPPWLVDPAKLRWRAGAPALRSATAAQVPQLLRRRRLPPGRRVVKVGFELGRAVAAWYLIERRRARREGRPEGSRSGLSRRLRLAFQEARQEPVAVDQRVELLRKVFRGEVVKGEGHGDQSI